MPLDETLLEPVGIDEALLEPADPGEEVLRAAPKPSVPVSLTPYGPTVDIPYPSWLDTARRTLIGPSPDEAALLEQRTLPRVSPAERLGVLGLLNKPTVTLPEWPRLEGDVPISAIPSVAAAAVWNALVKPAVEGFSSPGGIASAGALGVARGLAQAGRLGAARAVAAPGAAVFGAPMAAGAPEAVRRFGAATAEGDLQQQLETGAGAALTLTAPVGLAGAALRPGTPLPPRIELPPALAAQLPPALPRPVVPRGPSVARPPRPRPEVPATPAEPYEPILATIRNADARTVAQIQQLFPKAQLSREQARALRNQAFPPGPTAPPAEPPPTVPRGTIPPEPPVAPTPAPPPVRPAPAAPRATELDRLTTLEDAGMLTPAQSARLAELRTPATATAAEAAGFKKLPESPYHELKRGEGYIIAHFGLPDRITIDGLGVHTLARGKGLGAQLVGEVKKVADQTGKPITLTAHAESPTAQSKLEAFYGKNGFVRAGQDPLSNKPYFVYKPARVGAPSPTPAKAPEPPPEAPAAPAPAPEPPPAPPTPPTAVYAPTEAVPTPPAAAAPELFIPALDLAESDLTPGKLKTLAARDPAQLATLKKYFGVRTVPELTRKVQERFAAMRAEAEPKPAVEEPQVAPEPPAAAPAPEPAAPVAKAKAEVERVASTEGQRPAKAVKDELIARLKQAVEEAPEPTGDVVKDTATRVVIEIPGDGRFSIHNNKESLGEVLAAVERLRTTPTEPRKAGAPPPGPLTQQGRLTKDELDALTVYGDRVVAYHRLKDQLARADELYLEQPQKERLQRLVRRLGEPLTDAERATPPAEPPPMPPGPGAASPAEFEQRAARNATAALAGRRPSGASPPAITPPPLPAAQPRASVERTPYDVVSPVNSPQFTYWFGRLGETAARAWEKLALGSLEIRESIGRDVQRYVDQTLATLPRQYRKAGGRAFFDVLDGKTPAEIEATYRDQPGGDRIIAAANEVKTRLEAIRTTIRDVKREGSVASLMGLDKPTLQSMFAETISRERDTARMTKRQLADALTLVEYPDDWGYADGSYMPHLFYGEYKVSMQRPGDEGRTFVLRAETELAAKAALHKYVRDNPDLADLPWFIERDAVTPGDMVRLGDRRYWKLVGDMKESGDLTATEVKEALRGNVGRKSSKQKWWGSLQRRFGYANYERNYRRVFTSYLVGFHRWRVLSRLNREVVPMIESVRAEGRPNAANGLTDILEYMWGKPSKSSEFVDSVLRAIPGVNKITKPLALERWSRATRALVSGLLLRTPRYAVVNRLQPLQGLYPLLGERIMVKAKALQHTAEGRRLLDEANVRFDPGQYGEHSFIVPSKVRDIIEGWSGERSNQELSYLAMYLHAREQGLAHADAIPYSKLRGQLLTQFTPVAADIPPIMRGPFTGMLFQYKRFPIKQAELLYHMGRSGAVGGIARWLAMMALSGGAAFYMRQFWLPKDTRKRFRNGLVEIVGERGADAIMYGVPGMLGVDLSTSLTLGDEPWGENIYERIGRALVGPTASLAAETGAALLTPKRQPTTTREDVETMLHRFPSLRPLAELSRMLRGDVDLKAPDGETRYRRLFSESLKGLGSFRSTVESNQRIGVDAALTVDKERQALKNAYFVASQSPDSAVLDAAILKVQQFNARWPEFGLTAREIIDYIKYRNRGLNQSDIDRIVGKRYRSMLPPERTEE